MTISKNVNGTETTLKIEGRIDSKTAPEFDSRVRECFDDSEKMVIDLEGVNYISSAGLRVLLAAHKAMAHKNGLRIVNVCKEVKAIFDVTNFSGVLNIE